MKKFLVLLTALVIAATLTVSPASAAVETLDLGWDAAPAQPEAFDALPAPEADTVDRTHIPYTDENIIGGYIYYNELTGSICDADEGLISCVIPPVINGTTISKIDDAAFSKYPPYENLKKCDLISVTIPETVIYIGDGAFHNNKLDNVVIPGSVKYIGKHAFSRNTLKTLVIPDSVTFLGDSAFSENKLTTVSILGKPTLGSSVFVSNPLLESVDMPGVTEMGTAVFSGCSSLSSVNLGFGLTTIPNNTFNGCTSLKTIDIPASVDTIGVRAFSETNLSGTFELPKNLKNLGEGAFQACDSITELVIHGGVEYISEKAFYGCAQIKKITIEEGVKGIGDSAFIAGRNAAYDLPHAVAYGERVVYLPSTLEYIHSNAFTTHGSLSKAYVSDVYYGSCAGQFEKISISEGNDQLFAAKMHYYNGDEMEHNFVGGKCVDCGLDGTVHEHTETYGTDTHVHWTKCDVCG